MPMCEYRLAFEALEGRSGHEVGRLLLARLYREETGEEMPEVCIADGGKPYFAASPLHFSISHTKNHAFCALSRFPIGIDAEEKDRKINLRLADKILSPSERIRYDAAEDPHGALLRLWVLKEASVKLTGQGLRGYPSHTDFSPEDPRIREIDGCYVAILTDKGENHVI
jgi:4'-phosphopantetheinyl transferase